MKRSPMKRKAPKNPIPVAVRAEVMLRSGGWCEITHDELPYNHRGDHLHHRLMRSQGGDHTEENLILVCHQIHHYIHANPAVAYERGWLLRREAA